MVYMMILVILFTFNNLIYTMKIGKKDLVIVGDLENPVVIYKKKVFFINDVPVAHWNTNEQLHGMPKWKLIHLLLAGVHLLIEQIGNNEYRISLEGRPIAV